MCFLYKNSKSLLTECLLSTAFPTSLEYQDALLASKLVAAWKNLQPWNFWQKGPRPDPCFCFFWWKGHKLFFRVQSMISENWSSESNCQKVGDRIPLPEVCSARVIELFVGGSHWTHEVSRAFWTSKKNQPQKMKDKQPFFLSSSLHNRGIGTSEFPAFNLSESISVRKWSQHEFALICIFRGWVAKFSELIYLYI